MPAAFSIRGYAESMRGTAAAELGPFGFTVKDLPPMEVRLFRWWENELAAVKAAEADEEEEALGKGRAPKKRSISDLFAAAPPVDASDGGNAAEEDEEEALCAIMRRTKLRRKRKRKLEAAAAAEETTGGEGSEALGNSARKKALDKPNLRDELDTPEASKEPEDEHHLSTEKEKTPDLKGRKHGKINSLQKKADMLKYIESRKAIKVGKQRDIKKMLPLHSIMKKYTMHTSVKMVKEKRGNLKGTGVIELCRKSVRRVKFSEANDVLGSKKQSSKIPQLESLCKIFSDAMTSSSSTDMSSEGEKHIVAESSSSHMPEKAFTKAKEANENKNYENDCELSNTGLSTCLFDLNQALPESTDFNSPYIPSSKVSYLEHTQDGTFSMDQQVLDNGRENQKDLFFDPRGPEHQQHATDLDTRTKGKSLYALPNRMVQDSVQLQQNWCSMTLHHGVSQLSTGGEPPSCQCREYNLSHSEKPNFHSEMNLQQESRPAAGQTVRLMGKDLTVSKTRVDYLAETAQNDTGTFKDYLNTKMVLKLPRQGQPFLSLQAQSIPIVSANSAITAQAHFGYRTPHDFSHPLPTASVFSGDPSPYEDRSRNFTNLQSHQNVLLGCPALPNHGSAAFLQNSAAPWRYYSDHSTRTESPSASFLPTITRHVTPYSDYHANLPQPYVVYSASSSVHPYNSASFTWSHPDQVVKGVPDSRASTALPSRNADTGTARAVPDNFNTPSSSRYVVRSGPVKLCAGAKHILMPSENTEDDNSAPVYSCVSFSSNNGNVSAPQNKGADFRKL
ncbi:uncharacterized protein LOC133916884 [Phragmites australis]|uniref:uncharacterized protein LOC133916884 n=1 Tax=Phragmites australis TaxID=29695 RepID=UPI002D79B8D8|nr:uncharacterized protein LOC133916884 [Phragmites australis]